jgi:hypothetical protein
MSSGDNEEEGGHVGGQRAVRFCIELCEMRMCVCDVASSILPCIPLLVCP